MTDFATGLKNIIAIFDRPYFEKDVPDTDAPLESVLLQDMPLEWHGAFLLDALFYPLSRFAFIKVNTKYDNEFAHEETNYLNYIGTRMGIFTNEKKLHAVTHVDNHLANPSKNVDGLADWLGFEPEQIPSVSKKRINQNKKQPIHILAICILF